MKYTMIFKLRHSNKWEDLGMGAVPLWALEKLLLHFIKSDGLSERINGFKIIPAQSQFSIKEEQKP